MSMARHRQRAAAAMFVVAEKEAEINALKKRVAELEKILNKIMGKAVQ